MKQLEIGIKPCQMSMEMHKITNCQQQYGFVIEKELFSGNSLESAAIISNIAMIKTVLNWFSQKRIASVFVLILTLYIILNNSLSWILSRIRPIAI